MSSPSRNGLPIRADGHRVHQSPDGTLLIHNLRAGDQGSYTCSTYGGSQAVSRSTEVKVGPPGKQGLLVPRAALCGRVQALRSQGLRSKSRFALPGTGTETQGHGRTLPEPLSSVQRAAPPPDTVTVRVEEIVCRSGSWEQLHR